LGSIAICIHIYVNISFSIHENSGIEKNEIIRTLLTFTYVY